MNDSYHNLKKEIVLYSTILRLLTRPEQSDPETKTNDNQIDNNDNTPLSQKSVISYRSNIHKMNKKSSLSERLVNKSTHCTEQRRKHHQTLTESMLQTAQTCSKYQTSKTNNFNFKKSN